MFEKILIAHDGSDTADRALDIAIEMACRFSAELHMISVEEDLPKYARTIDDVEQEKEAEDSYFALLGARSKQRTRMQGVDLQHVIVTDTPSTRLQSLHAKGSSNCLSSDSPATPAFTITFGAAAPKISHACALYCSRRKVVRGRMRTWLRGNSTF